MQFTIHAFFGLRLAMVQGNRGVCEGSGKRQPCNVHWMMVAGGSQAHSQIISGLPHFGKVGQNRVDFMPAGMIRTSSIQEKGLQ